MVSFNTRSLSEEERQGEYGDLSDLLALGTKISRATAAAAAASAAAAADDGGASVGGGEEDLSLDGGDGSSYGGGTGAAGAARAAAAAAAEAAEAVAEALAKKKTMGGPKAAKKFKQAIRLDNGVMLQVNGPGEVRADGGVGGGAI